MKTYLDDFREKFPNAKRAEGYCKGYPLGNVDDDDRTIPACFLYGEKNFNCEESGDCKTCWDMEIEEDEEEEDCEYCTSCDSCENLEGCKLTGGNYPEFCSRYSPKYYECPVCGRKLRG